MSRRILEWALIVVGLVCLFIFGSSLLRYRLFQQRATAITPGAATSVSTGSHTNPHVIGQLTIQRIGLSVAMLEGDDDGSLDLAAGHMPGTAMAGQQGNVVIAGHRDTAFWPLRHVRPGDLVTVKGNTDSKYRVVATTIVDPADTAALADTKQPVLTLVTCYPFRHVGPAPKRFIVRANLVR